MGLKQQKEYCAKTEPQIVVWNGGGGGGVLFFLNESGL